MRLPVLSITILLLTVPTAQSGEEPEAIIARAVKALGGEANLSRARAVQAKIKGIHYDPGVKESLVDGAKLTGELITQLPTQVKLSIDAETAGVRVSLIQVLNGRKSWTRDDERSQEDDPANFADFELSAYVDYVSSLVPLLKDKSYTLSSAGEATVKELPAVAVKVASKGRPDVTLYFDKVSGFLLKTEHQRRDSTTNKVVTREEYFSDYQDVNPARMEEQTLKAAKVNSDDSALLEFLRKESLSDEARRKIKELIRGLSDTSFQARQKAKESLVAQGGTAVPLLTQALKDADPEVAGLAKECLEAIGKGPDPAVTLAAIRLLAMRKPAAAAGVLLSYLPTAPNETVAREVRAALAAVAFRDGKPDKALLQALNDKEPQRQAAAAALVGPGGNSREMPGQRLLLPGLKRATKGEVYQDKKKSMEYEVSDIQIFNKLDDSVFSKP
jgi:outer membrane lipoprotein-sorting protein